MGRNWDVDGRGGLGWVTESDQCVILDATGISLRSWS